MVRLSDVDEIEDVARVGRSRRGERGVYMREDEGRSAGGEEHGKFSASSGGGFPNLVFVSLIHTRTRLFLLHRPWLRRGCVPALRPRPSPGNQSQPHTSLTLFSAVQPQPLSRSSVLPLAVLD